ncbi:ribosomal protein L11 methyltransferase [Lachnospiraceae bacterium XBB1006]|nr:ribosomal protein L11 methyltransferase [Lachnospiraceae bacterium XBB1006]
MKWKEFTIKTTTMAEELVCNMLYERGITSVEIIDNVPLTKEEVEEMYIDIEAELPPDEGDGAVRFYLEEDADEKQMLDSVKEGLQELAEFMDIGEGSIVTSETEDVDWINNWKEFFKPFYLDDILIKPHWEAIPQGAKYRALIEIDPGTSFGTGQHETTQLCIRGLEKYMKEEDAVLDLGCGSGILSVIALKLGAKHAVLTDIDPICEQAAIDNMEMNHLTKDMYDIHIGNLIDDEKLQQTVGENAYDVVLANILADVIIPMAPAAYRAVKRGGTFITSGIIDFKEDAVKEALTAAGFTIKEVNHMGEWVGIIAEK